MCKHYASAALQAQYGGQDCKTIVPKTPPSHHDSNLPFTGFNVPLVLLVAILLLCAGVAIRKFGKDAR